MNHDDQIAECSRRDFVTAVGQAGLLAGCGLSAGAIAGEGPKRPAKKDAKPKPRLGKAQHCIFIWLGGGSCHIDTWDPKRKSTSRKEAGSYYDAVPTAIDGAKVCEHLKRTAPLLDRAVLVRSLHHEVIDEHAAATNRLHTGRPTSGTIVYPSIGSVVAQQLGPGGDGVPSYVVMGYPNFTRGPGFLGSKYTYVYLTETKAGPTGLQRPPGVSDARQKRREALLAKMREDFLRRNAGDAKIEAYAGISLEAFRLAGPKFMSTFELDREPAELREAYGSEFGQRCLLARRLVGSGVRFIEVASNLNFVNGTGWDTHNQGQLKQHVLIDELDRALSTLLVDLERHKLLDKTLVVVTTEFGRPPEFDSGGGRGHHSKAFSSVLAGGGLRGGQVIGQTDEVGRTIVKDPVSVPDFHATIYATLGINPAEELYAGERPVPITDGGKVLRIL